MMTLEFTLNRDAAPGAQIDCLVVGVFSDNSFAPAAKAVDDASGGKLSELYSSHGCALPRSWRSATAPSTSAI